VILAKAGEHHAYARLRDFPRLGPLAEQQTLIGIEELEWGGICMRNMPGMAP